MRSRVAALLLVLPLLQGCPSPQDDSPQQDVGQAEAQRLSRELDDLPGVGDAEVVYALTPSNSGDATALLPLEPGADARAVADQALRALWLSRMDPLTSVAVAATDPQDPSRSVSETLTVAGDGDELRRRFGPRPAGVGEDR